MPEKLFFQILLDFFEEKLPEFNSFFLKLLEENRIFFTKNKKRKSSYAIYKEHCDKQEYFFAKENRIDIYLFALMIS